MMQVAPASSTMAVVLIVLAVVAALFILIGWAIARGLSAAGRSAADAASRAGGPRSWPGQGQADEPVVDVTARDITDDVVKMIQENNRLLREILDELRRHPAEPPGPSSGHLE